MPTAVVGNIFFRNLTETKIAAYAATGEGLDKAGGFGIQGIGALLFNKIEGDYYIIVGLPISKVAEKLTTLGVETWLSPQQ